MRRNKNIAVGIVEGSSYVCAGLVVAAAISGRSHNFGEDLATTLLYFVIGQSWYIMCFKVLGYATKMKLAEKEKIFDITEELKTGQNTAVGVVVGTTMISYTIVLSGAISLSDSIVVVLIAICLGSVALFLVRLFCEYCILS